MNRREFLKSTAAALCLEAGYVQGRPSTAGPPHLRGYEELYAMAPRAASRAWFREAKFGLFLHFGVYSQLGRGEWVLLREKIPLGEYRKLAETFRPEKFDADFITDLALESGMRYVNLTSRHHDSFSLFHTARSEWNSVQSCGRDLVAELAAACHAKGLGLFLYYSYAADWVHPYFYSRDSGWSNARPDYSVPEPSYLWKNDSDSAVYMEFVHAQLRELLTSYGPLAGIWLDPIMGYYARPDLFRIEETYSLIRSLQPHCLVSFKQGANGDEDFATPERGMVSLVDRVRAEFGEERARLAESAWKENRIKQLEFCDTLLPKSWGYHALQQEKSATPYDVMRKLENASRYRANLLLNTGPRGDGSIPEGDIRTLHEVGKRLRARS